jgi:hypothetical protein
MTKISPGRLDGDCRDLKKKKGSNYNWRHNLELLLTLLAPPNARLHGANCRHSKDNASPWWCLRALQRWEVPLVLFLPTSCLSNQKIYGDSRGVGAAYSSGMVDQEVAMQQVVTGGNVEYVGGQQAGRQVLYDMGGLRMRQQ